MQGLGRHGELNPTTAILDRYLGGLFGSVVQHQSDALIGPQKANTNNICIQRLDVQSHRIRQHEPTEMADRIENRLLVQLICS